VTFTDLQTRRAGLSASAELLVLIVISVTVGAIVTLWWMMLGGKQRSQRQSVAGLKWHPDTGLQ